ncbi:hypothetical protein [Neisseria dumasiana]|uniref:hypothetical protein n=1 Tax=Neisseria dumasiana TaxID=1931275 RepID=UPI000A1967AD|nr:hypothetical protein [Neisseria dumasiana]OSI15485.1 hypothetical protein BV914_07020 [Neisseria dumasiana]
MDIQTLISTCFVAALGAGVQIYIAKKSRDQNQNNLKIQELVSYRSVASFIADKRQKWIDDLREDIALHLASAQEYVWKWDAVRSINKQLNIKHQTNMEKLNCEHEKKAYERDFEKKSDESLTKFREENGIRYTNHHQRHFRIKLRLNPKEEKHILLRECLDKIDKNMLNIRNADEINSMKIINDVSDLIDEANVLTEEILKSEWERIKTDALNPN